MTQSNTSLNKAFWDALKTQFQPSMLFALALPFIASILACIILYTTAFNWSGNLFIDYINWLGFNTENWFVPIARFAVSLTALTLIGIAIGLGLTAVFITPIVIKKVANQYYPQLDKKGKFANTLSIWNTFKVASLFLLGWNITLPLWLIPGMGFVLNLIWTAYLFSHITRIDALAEYAQYNERQYILKTHHANFWKLGFICALLVQIPLVNFFVPVFSIIFCVRYSLGALHDLRKPANKA